MRRIVWFLFALLLFGQGAYSQTLTPGSRARPGSMGALRVQRLTAASPFMTGLTTFNGPITQSIGQSGAVAGPLFPNVFQVTDTAAISGLNFLTAYSFSDYAGGGATAGGRIALNAVAGLTAPSNAGSTFRDYVAGQFLAWAQSADNGTNLTTSPGGNFFALSPYYILESGATNIGEASTMEANSIVKTGASVKYKNIISLVAGGALDAVQGSSWDAMLAMSAITGSVGFQDGILIGSQNGAFPITTTGTVLRTFDAVSVKDGINFISLNVTNCPFQALLFSVCQNSMALGLGAPVQNSFINVISNAGGLYPTSTTTAYAFSDNFTNGSRELDFWNSDTLAGSPSFNFYQKTGTSAATLEASLAAAGLTLGKSIPLILSGATSGTTTVTAPAVASGTLTLPAATDTLVGKATTDNFTNKTLTDPINKETHVSTAGFTLTASTTLTTITGLDQAFTAAGLYSCNGYIHFTTAPTTSNGAKIALTGDGSVTVNTLAFNAMAMNNAAIVVGGQGTSPTLGTAAFTVTTLAMTDIYLNAIININLAGTIHVQLAEGTASGTIASTAGNARWDCHRAA